MYDTVVVGTGPAGLTAAVYGMRACLDMVVLEQNYMSGGQVINTYEVDNYPGLPGISGVDMSMRLREHAQGLGAAIVRGKAEKIANTPEGHFLVETGEETYETRTVIFAAGAHHKKLEVPGEDVLTGKGVSYCATCDGAFYRDKTVAVVGGGDVAAEDAVFLSRICKKVYVIHRRDTLRAAKRLGETLASLDNVEMVWDTIVKGVEGQELVTGVLTEHVKTGESKVLSVDGVFIAVGITPDSKLLEGLVEVDESGYIVAGEDCETSTQGIFAAGDVRTKQLRQIITAAADGANAVTGVERSLIGGGS